MDREKKRIRTTNNTDSTDKTAEASPRCSIRVIRVIRGYFFCTSVSHEDKCQAQDPEPQPLPNTEILQVALASGLCGFFLGMACGWQIPVQSAQAIAGLVNYPADNPFYMYHVQTWTLLHQVPALLLVWGFSERTVSIMLGGLIGMASFQALALCTLAVGGNRLIACAAPLLFLAVDACSDSSAYPIRILSDQPWIAYGAAGASLTLLTWALLGLRRYRVATFLMGIAPAIHPALGSWCMAVALLAMFWNSRAEGRSAGLHWTSFLAGCAATAASLAVHWRQTRGLPHVPREISWPLVEAFASGWDSHRVPFPLDEPILLVAFCGILLAGVWLRFFQSDLPSGSRLLLRILTVSAALGVALCAVTHLQDFLPLAISMAMPGRFINIIGLAFPALIVGLLARYRTAPLVSVLLAGLMIHLPLRMLSMEYSSFYVPPAGSVLIAVAMLLLAICGDLSPTGANRTGAVPGLLRLIERFATLGVALLGYFYLGSDPKLALLLWGGTVVLVARVGTRTLSLPSVQRILQRQGLRAAVLVSAVAGVLVSAWLLGPAMTLGLLLAGIAVALPSQLRSNLKGRAIGAIAFVLIIGSFTTQAITSYASLPDWRNDPVFARASKGRGLLLTAPTLRGVQLQARRGVLLEGPSLNQLPYVPASGPEMNRILKSIYGEDLLIPRSFNWLKTGGLKRYCGHQTWEAREADEWRRLAREFGFSDVLTYSDWSLKLPVIARSKELTLYHIPRSEQWTAAVMSSKPIR